MEKEEQRLGLKVLSGILLLYPQRLTINAQNGEYVIVPDIGDRAGIILVSSLSTASSACFFITRYSSADATKIEGALSVRISRSSAGGSPYIWNNTGKTDMFIIRSYVL